MLEKVREDKGVEMPETIVLLPNQTNLIEISIKDMKAIDKKSFHATYKVLTLKHFKERVLKLNSILIRIKRMLNLEGQ